MILFFFSKGILVKLGCKRNAVNYFIIKLLYFYFSREEWRCTGSGVRKDGTGSELLPALWNSDTSVYQLNYQDTDDSHYTLKVTIYIYIYMVVNIFTLKVTL